MDDEPRVLAVVPDLFFAAKISATAKQTGTRLEFVNSSQDLMIKSKKPISLIILDLNADSFNPVLLIEKLKTDPASTRTPLVGFVQHEMSELMEAARAAGCDQVLTRNAFSRDLPAILRQSTSSNQRKE